MNRTSSKNRRAGESRNHQRRVNFHQYVFQDRKPSGLDFRIQFPGLIPPSTLNRSLYPHQLVHESPDFQTCTNPVWTHGRRNNQSWLSSNHHEVVLNSYFPGITTTDNDLDAKPKNSAALRKPWTLKIQLGGDPFHRVFLLLGFAWLACMPCL